MARKRSLWSKVPDVVKRKLQEGALRNTLRRRHESQYRREQRAKEGVGRKGVQLRASRGTRDRLRAVTHMHERLRAMHGHEVRYVGWQNSAAESLDRLVKNEFARLRDTLSHLASTDERAANVLDRADQIANGFF